MITGQGLTDPLEEEETASCEDFSSEAGIAYILYAQKDVFSALSLSSVPFASGSLSVDDIQLTQGGFLSASGQKLLWVPLTYPPAREPAIY
jgi:hypothetical protein